MMWRKKASAKYPYRWSTIIEALNKVDQNEVADEYYTELQELHKPNSKEDVILLLQQRYYFFLLNSINS